MAVIAKLEQPKKENVKMTSAEVIYGCTFDWPTYEIEQLSKTYYANEKYSWEFSPINTGSTVAAGIYTFVGLSIGKENQLTAKVTITCTQTTETRYWYDDGYWKDVKDEEDNVIGKEWVSDMKLSDWKVTSTNNNYLIGTAITTIKVYTRPGNFNKYDFNKIDPIHEQLSVQVTQDWCEHCAKYLSWKYQKNKYNSISYDTYGGKSGEAISAYLFQKQIAIAESASISHPAKDETLLTIDFFKSLGDAISKTDID